MCWEEIFHNDPVGLGSLGWFQPTVVVNCVLRNTSWNEFNPCFFTSPEACVMGSFSNNIARAVREPFSVRQDSKKCCEEEGEGLCECQVGKFWDDQASLPPLEGSLFYVVSV